jgi:hypothetical protein
MTYRARWSIPVGLPFQRKPALQHSLIYQESVLRYQTGEGVDEWGEEWGLRGFDMLDIPWYYGDLMTCKRMGSVFLAKKKMRRRYEISRKAGKCVFAKEEVKGETAHAHMQMPGLGHNASIGPKADVVHSVTPPLA